MKSIKINQRGAILVFSLLVLVMIMSITFAVLGIFLPKIRTASDPLRSIVALYTVDSVTEWCIDNSRSWPPSVPNLVGHWTFDDGTGTTAVDSTGNGYNGTLTNGPTWTFDRKIGTQALLNDGTNDVVVLPAAAPLLSPGVGNFTAALWVKWNALPAAGDDLIADGNTVTGDSWYLIVTTLNRIACVYQDGATIVAGVSPSDSLVGKVGQWVHYACVRQGTNVYLYENGTVVGSGFNAGLLNIDTNNSTNPFIRLNLAANGIQATVDDVRVYNRELSIDEIRSLIPSLPPTMSNGATFQVYSPASSFYSTSCTEPSFDHRIVGSYQDVARSLEVH